MRSWVLSACCVLLGSQVVTIPQDKLLPQEAFFLRRMTEFWKDRDYGLVKKQIDEFLSSHESSNIHNNLYALLGDILYQESDYKGALETYQKISDAVLLEKITGRKSQCLYITGCYDEVIELLEPYFEKGETIEHQDEMRFIFADSIFRKMRETADHHAHLELASRAKPYLQGLYETPYKDKVILPLAEVYREMKEPKNAAPLYLMLSEKMPEQKEELLLQAASLQLEFDALQALDSFQKVVDIGGKEAPQAARQELFLLFQNDRFSDLISRAPKMDIFLEDKTLFEFCLARSYFKLDQLPEAIVHYQRFIEKEKDATPHKRAAFLTLIHCAQKTDNAPLFDQVLTQFLTDFPKDEEAGKALLLHAQSSIQRGDIVQASTDLNQLVKDFPDFPEQETVLYDQAVLLSKTEHWNESRSAFLSYLLKFPTTPHSNAIWASIVHSSVQELKKATPELVNDKKQQLATDLSQALTLTNLFSSDEESAYQFLLGQLMFDLNHFSESAIELNRFCQKYPQHPSVPEAFLLQALAHRELKSGPDLFIPAAEKALTLVDDFKQKTALRLQLFNNYLTVKQFDKAADSLYQTFIVEGTDVQPENQLWLVGYLFGKGEKEKTDHVFKKILKVDDAFQVHFDPAQLYLESEAIKFAKTLAPNEKESVLRSLMALQGRHETLPWKHRDTALLELGKTLITLKKRDEAFSVFENLLSKGDEVSSTVRNMALLEKSRILITTLPPGDKNENNPQLGLILSTFKDLQIQKVLQEEPVHLEAALDYADLRTSFAPEPSRIEAALFFLNRVKEDFNAKDDPYSTGYHEDRLRFPDKDRIYQNYMKCVEAEILAWESKDAQSKNEIEKADHAKKVASSLFEEVMNDPNCTDYLKNRVNERLNEIQ